LRTLRILCGLAAALLATLVSVDAAGATARPSLPLKIASAHFVIWYDPATASSAYASTAATEFEDSYSRLVNGGGGVPNAGLLAPITSPTAVYLMIPTGTTGGSSRSTATVAPLRH